MCLRQASVGAHCFECVKANAPSRREQRIVRAATGRPPALTVTAVIIAVNVAIFLVTRDLNRSGAGIRRTITAEWSLWGPGVDALGEADVELLGLAAAGAVQPAALGGPAPAAAAGHAAVAAGGGRAALLGRGRRVKGLRRRGGQRTAEQ